MEEAEPETGVAAGTGLVREGPPVDGRTIALGGGEHDPVAARRQFAGMSGSRPSG
jgi:hypothetical protein